MNLQLLKPFHFLQPYGTWKLLFSQGVVVLVEAMLDALEVDVLLIDVYGEVIPFIAV